MRPSKTLNAIAATALMLCASAVSWSGTMIGKIDDISKGVITIDDSSYKISSSALIGYGPDRRSNLKLNNLLQGQIVEFSYDRDRITRLELLHGETEVPN